jgi:hypothetical protein
VKNTKGARQNRPAINLRVPAQKALQEKSLFCPNDTDCVLLKATIKNENITKNQYTHKLFLTQFYQEL